MIAPELEALEAVYPVVQEMQRRKLARIERLSKLDLASNIGIPRTSCYALNDLKASLFATALHRAGKG